MRIGFQWLSGVSCCVDFDDIFAKFMFVRGTILVREEYGTFQDKGMSQS